MLPEKFLDRMKKYLGKEYEEFYNSYQKEVSRGLRINTLKTTTEQFFGKSTFTLTKIPWTEEGYYYTEKEHPGKHPFHEAGVYYIQEPSAMAVGELTGACPGEKILDLCASPGGKTTHIAQKMRQQGLLVANEINPSRAKILSQNIERMGIRNAVVMNESPEHLSAGFPDFFDRILVDAPCSGEGMFRKNEEARLEWTEKAPEICAERQLDILRHAAAMLRPGGRLVYSTCTFSPEEDERVIESFLRKNEEFELEDVPCCQEFDRGREEWTAAGNKNITKTIRLWPHKIEGEGHFIAVMRRKESKADGKWRECESIKDKRVLNDFRKFVQDNLTEEPEGKFLLFGGELYLVPEHLPSIDKLRVLRPGWHLGTLKKKRFEPSHAMALSLSGLQTKRSYNCKASEIYSYLKGEALPIAGEDGWTLVETEGYAIGWGKKSGALLKNHYPKGLRRIY